jgi:hypothetical protein
VGWEAYQRADGTLDLMLDGRAHQSDLRDLDEVFGAVRRARRARGRDEVRMTVIDPDGHRGEVVVPA